MRQQDKKNGSIDPCIIVRILERTMRFFGIQACAVQKTKKDLESEKGKQIVDWAKLALKQRDLRVAEEFCLHLKEAIEIGGYGDIVYLRRELKKIQNGIDCVRSLEKEVATTTTP